MVYKMVKDHFNVNYDNEAEILSKIKIPEHKNTFINNACRTLYMHFLICQITVQLCPRYTCLNKEIFQSSILQNTLDIFSASKTSQWHRCELFFFLPNFISMGIFLTMIFFIVEFLMHSWYLEENKSADLS